MNLKFDDVIRDILRTGRNVRLYYDRELQTYRIGWAQQFLLCYIYRHPGITAQELSEIFLTEKSTISKGIKKLCIEGYVQIEADEKDRRAKRLYPSPAAEEVVLYIGRLQERLSSALAAGITPSEKTQLEVSLKQVCRISEAIGEVQSDAESRS